MARLIIQGTANSGTQPDYKAGDIVWDPSTGSIYSIVSISDDGRSVEYGEFDFVIFNDSTDDVAKLSSFVGNLSEILGTDTRKLDLVTKYLEQQEKK